MKYFSILKHSILLIFICVIYYFFKVQIENNYDEISQATFHISWLYILYAITLIFLTYLLTLFAWITLIRPLCKKEITFNDAFAIFNIAQLAKYIPGKIWGVTLQIHLLSLKGVSKKKSILVSAVMFCSIVFSAIFISLLFAYLENIYLSREVLFLPLITIGCLYCLIIFGSFYSINFLIGIINLLLKKKIEKIYLSYFEVLKMHALCLLSNITYGLAGYFVAISVGFPKAAIFFVPIFTAVLIADITSIFVFFAPNGLGAREGLLFAILKSTVSVGLCLIFPVIFRLVTIGCDVIFGSLALFSIRKLK